MFITSLSYMIIHEIRRLLPELKDIPVKEIIYDLTAINLVELEDRGECFYRVPTPNNATQALLDKLDISIPKLIPKRGLPML